MPISRWINRENVLCTHSGILRRPKKETLQYATRWMKLEDICKWNKSQMDKCCMILLIEVSNVVKFRESKRIMVARSWRDSRGRELQISGHKASVSKVNKGPAIQQCTYGCLRRYKSESKGDNKLPHDNNSKSNSQDLRMGKNHRGWFLLHLWLPNLAASN